MIRKFIASAALGSMIIVGASSGAFAADTAPKDPAAAEARHAARCAKAPEVIAKIKAAESKAADRIAKLEVAQAKATAAGRTELASKIGDRITKVKEHAAKAADKLAKVEAKVAEKCPAVTG